MQGIPEPATQRGIIPRSFEHIFEAIDASENMKYLVHASYLEIYNEEIRDLLGQDTKKKLELKEHPDKGIYVPGKLPLTYLLGFLHSKVILVAFNEYYMPVCVLVQKQYFWGATVVLYFHVCSSSGICKVLSHYI